MHDHLPSVFPTVEVLDCIDRLIDTDEGLGITAAAAGADGDIFACLEDGRILRVGATGPPQVLAGHAAEVLGFDGSGSEGVSWSKDRTVRRWSLEATDEREGLVVPDPAWRRGRGWGAVVGAGSTHRPFAMTSNCSPRRLTSGDARPPFAYSSVVGSVVFARYAATTSFW